MPARLAALTFAALVLLFPRADANGSPPPADPPAVAFDRDVKPILTAHCLKCHGPDKQKGGLRLDRRADALNGGDSGPALAPGKPADSLLLKLVAGDDPDRVMPPSGDRLTAAQVAALRVWVEQGATWPPDGTAAADPADWWAFKPVRRHSVPEIRSAKHEIRNEIDRFVLAKLREKGLVPSPEADRRTLIRRLHFDLIGLPPTPEEVEAFEKDDAPDAYEKLVDKLLASPRHGERWARHWLDVVHFGETHGYDKDQPRPNAWPYRDYVIRSLNADKPYGRFVKEQLAGDVLYPGTVDGIEALGFLSAGPWDFIGHVELPESKADGKVARHLDRDDVVATTANTFVSLTAQCAQCHNHKFDPITQEDYYRLQAVFAAIDRTDKAFDPDPAVAARRADLTAKKTAAAAKITAVESAARAKAGDELAAVERQLAAKGSAVPRPPEYGYHSAIEDKPDRAKWVQVDLGESKPVDHVLLRPCHDDFGGVGAGFGFPVRFKVELADDPEFKAGVVVVADHTTADFANPGAKPVRLAAGGKAGRFVRLTATTLARRLSTDFILAVAELEAVDAAGKNLAAGRPVAALDTIEAPVRWRRANLTDGLFPASEGLSADERAKLAARRDELLARAMSPEAAAGRASAKADRAAAEAGLAKLPAPKVTYAGAVHTGGGNFVGTGAAGGKPRPIHILPRGDVTRPGREVGPGAIPAIPGINGRFELPANHPEGTRRAALANWVADPQNPLTWRSIVNRVWQYHFGRGIVETPSDFGKMGQMPTHPELLDWLAADFRDGGGSLKKLHKLIVMSATYRQASSSNPAAETVDADNRYLWRQTRRKLEAEAVRDSILWAAGKLDLTMGGPSFQDFVVEKPEHSPHYQYHLFDPEAPAGHRRAVYRYTVRSKPQPLMAALDCADPSLAVDRRNQTITPQQALALLNNKLAVAMARHFAARVEKLAPDDAGRVAAAVRISLGRPATVEERTALAAYAKEHGLANACRMILNLNEFVFVD